MTNLYPIIRRQRRPLIEVAAAPVVVVGNVEPIEVKAEMLKAETEPAEAGTTNDAPIAAIAGE